MIKNNNLIDKKYIVILDNGRSHRNRLLSKAQKYFNLLFLPEYTPFINSIEYYFYFLKKEIRKGFHNNKKELFSKII